MLQGHICISLQGRQLNFDHGIFVFQGVSPFFLTFPPIAFSPLSKSENENEKPKTFTGSMQSLPKIENQISLIVIEILSFRQKTLLLLTKEYTL